VGVESLGDPDGYPILWCHGGLSSRLDAVSVDQVARSLGASILSIDRPGIGSAAPMTGLTVADWASIALDEMAHRGHQRFSVAGWSAGGPYALACAAVAPERVERVAAIASMHPLVDDAYRRELGLRLDRILFRWAVGHPTSASLLIKVGSRIPDRLVVGDVMKSALETEQAALRAHSKEILAFISESTRCGSRGVVDDYARLASGWGFDLTSITANVSVWHGRDDPMVPVAHGRDLAGLLTNATFMELAGRGHYLPFTDGARIIADLMPS